MSPENAAPDGTDTAILEPIGDALSEGAPTDLVEFGLQRFLDEKALWAANFFVLWPLGLTLAVDVEDDVATRLTVREWAYPEGEKIETINQTSKDNQESYEVFLAFVRDRVLAMKPEERGLTLRSYAKRAIAEADQLIVAAP